MSMRTLVRWSVLVAVSSATPLHAQQLAERVAAIRDGMANFHFTGRPGVCGDGQRFMRIGRHSYMGSYTNEARYEQCMPGPMQVRVTVRNGNVERVETWAGSLRRREGQDLGAVPAPEAARFLMSIASRGSSYASAKAIMPAVLADSATVWPTLLTIASDTDGRSKSTRNDAMFWLSRYAAGAVAGHRNSPIDDDDENSDGEDLKAHAVFVMSQLPHGEGVPSLLEVARTNKDAHVRGKALFWLGQSGDPRALSLFESILR
jgi:HEAT repeat protein